MKANNVEELIGALESFDIDEPVIIGVRNGRHCLIVGHHRIPISITSFDEPLL